MTPLFSDAFADVIICKESERSALSTFRNDLEDSSDRLSSWRGADCCHWEGVICDNLTGQVRELRLRNPHNAACSSRSYGAAEFQAYDIHKLGGRLNPSLLQLDCGFHGAVPSRIANLSRLRHLNLGDPFPIFAESKLRVSSMQWLRHLSSLEHLDLTGADASSASDWLGSLGNLHSLLDLRLSRCGLPPVISGNAANLSRLAQLHLSWNNFDSPLPRWIYSLTDLVSLNLSHCGFYDHLPTGLQNMTKLEYLNLSSNHFTSNFPPCITRLSNLKVLAAAGNIIEGELPATMDNLTSLVTLELSLNRIGGMLPKSLSNLCNLQELYLYINTFSGGLPDFSGCISHNLRVLYLGWNNLSGPLPSNLKQAAKLRELDLTYNKLTGPLPSSLGELQEFTFKPSRDWIPPFQLHGLTLRSWRLGPEFPPWIKHLKHLQYLSLANTGIEDAIPSWFWRLTPQNIAVDMKHNLITGPLPRVSSNVTILNLSFNSISGSMHQFLCENSERNMRLEILDLANNYLSGEIPDCWGNWSSLSVLRLQANNLTGKIPSSVGLLTRLQSLHLRGNNDLSGSLQNCTGLIVGGVQPSSQQVLGRDPGGALPSQPHLGAGPSGQQSVRADTLVLRRFQCDGVEAEAGRTHVLFCRRHVGVVPDSQYLVVKGRLGLYSNILHWVMTLDISDNNLTGPIPAAITSLSKLQGLNLSRNSLTGRIPEHIGGMSLLESLDISKNKLSGEIPQTIAELSFLGNLNLSCNKLTGRIPSSTQLQGFDASSFAGNELCGAPLLESCGGNEGITVGGEDEEERAKLIFETEEFGLVLSIVLGFAVGFWTVIVSLVVNVSWRNAYFGVLTRMGNYVYYVWVKFLLR
ncbi:hypothetical protein SASPL_157275 [Salvia splendens]|uniref:Leucine-rich repeat-containing N-terminal plant-type domain-containing protein n=1 Tax=Salvia splendens TaxID=180675 RepID=A0A8X8YUJ4_SALSN|nr:hypothetical protein SASPL_157275 [Salvia splendens]